MNSSKLRARIVGAIAAAGPLPGSIAGSPSARSEVRIGADGIGGVVTSARGVEAGVWVAKDIEGRIDGPAAGWKGRGIRPSPLAD